VQGVAEKLALSEKHVYKMCRLNRLPFVRIGGSLRFRPEDIDAWLESRVIKPVA
jgi:excisionase family DNA binding protein